MLVLTRKLQEKIRIGDQVTVTVLRMKGKAVRLGIEAPASVSVIRGELVHKVELEVTASDDAGLSTATEATANSTPMAHSARMESDWARDSHPRLPLRHGAEQSPPSEVRFTRISRDKAAQIMAGANASAGGPLRSMLDQRSKAV